MYVYMCAVACKCIMNPVSACFLYLNYFMLSVGHVVYGAVGEDEQQMIHLPRLFLLGVPVT